MLDSFLDVAYQHEAREQTERDAVALLKQLPAEDLLKIASGAKVAWLEPCGPGGSGSFLDKFKGTPLFDEALALEQEELQAEMTNLERRKEQRSTQQLEQGIWDMQDQLRIKKRLLELRLAQQDAGMGAQAGGGAPSPLMNAAPIPEAGAQGAGAVGAESAPVDANKTASIKLALAMGDVLKMKSLVSGHAPAQAAGAIKDRLKDAPKALGQVNKELGKFKSLSSSSMLAAKKTAASKAPKPEVPRQEEPSAGRGKAFLHSVGDMMQGGAEVGGGLGGIAGAVHGFSGGGDIKDRVLRALGHGAAGMGVGAIAGGLGAGAGAAPGAAVGSMTASPLMGAVGGAGAAYGLASQLPAPYHALAPSAAALSGLSGLVSGARSKQTTGKHKEWNHAQLDAMEDEYAGKHGLTPRSKAASVTSSTVDAFGRELARTDFAKAADAIAIEKAATEAGAVLAKEAVGLGGGLGALGTMATNYIKNPANARTVMGAGAGALGGLASGLRKDEHGQRHLLGGLAQGAAGGALGGLAGHAAQNIGTSLASGTKLAPAVQQYGAGWANKVRDVASAMKPQAPVQIAA